MSKKQFINVHYFHWSRFFCGINQNGKLLSWAVGTSTTWSKLWITSEFQRKNIMYRLLNDRKMLISCIRFYWDHTKPLMVEYCDQELEKYLHFSFYFPTFSNLLLNSKIVVKKKKLQRILQQHVIKHIIKSYSFPSNILPPYYVAS